MIGGNTRVNADAPPYFLYSGFDITPVGINAVGLQSAGIPNCDIADLKRAYRLLYRPVSSCQKHSIESLPNAVPCLRCS